MDDKKQISAETILFAHHCQDLLKEKKIKEAMDLCERGVRNFPFYAEGHYILGRCYQTLGQIDDAKNELERTLFYAPVHLKALNALAFIHYKKKLKNIADEYMLNAALNDPLNFELHEYLKTEGLYTMLYPPLTQKDIPDDVILEEEKIADIEEAVDEEENKTTIEDDPGIDIENMFVNSAAEEAEEEEPPESEPEETGSALELDDSREVFEVNSIIENISEVESNKLDLSQYANIEDDFSTLLTSMERDFRETLNENVEEENDELNIDQINAEEEQFAEEKPFGNTAILFDGPPEETELPEVSTEEIISQQEETEEIHDINLLEEEIPDQQKEADTDIDFQDELIEESEVPEGDKFLDNPDQLSKIIDQLEKRDEDTVQKVKVENLEQDIPGETDREEGDINDIMNNSSLVTPTFGEILIAQKKFGEARTVFVKLTEENPENERYKKKLQFLDKLIAMQK